MKFEPGLVCALSEPREVFRNQVEQRIPNGLILPKGTIMRCAEIFLWRGDVGYGKYARLVFELDGADIDYFQRVHDSLRAPRGFVELAPLEQLADCAPKDVN